MAAQTNAVKVKKHYSSRFIIWTIFKYLSLIFVSFCAVIPLVSCVITAFKSDAEYKSTNVMKIPQSWFNFGNFVKAFQKADMGLAFVNSADRLYHYRYSACICSGQI